MVKNTYQSVDAAVGVSYVAAHVHQVRMQAKEQVQELQQQLRQLQQKHDALLQRHAAGTLYDQQPTQLSVTAAHGTPWQQLRASIPQGNTSNGSSMRASASAGEPAAFAVQFSRALQIADADRSEAARRAAAAEQAAAELRQQLCQQELELGHLHRQASTWVCCTTYCLLLHACCPCWMLAMIRHIFLQHRTPAC